MALGPGWMNAAWLRGVHDLLDWVLGDRPAAPLSDAPPACPPCTTSPTKKQPQTTWSSKAGQAGARGPTRLSTT